MRFCARFNEKFLLNRKQNVRVHNNSNKLIDELIGVPQRTILWPLLFTIYINDIFQTNIHMLMTR